MDSSYSKLVQSPLCVQIRYIIVTKHQPTYISPRKTYMLVTDLFNNL